MQAVVKKRKEQVNLLQQGSQIQSIPIVNKSDDDTPPQDQINDILDEETE